MAKRSDIEKQIAALQADLDNADTDDEVWIKDGDREIKVSGKRATSILGRYADLWKEEDPADDAEDEDDELDADAQPKSKEGYFRKGK